MRRVMAAAGRNVGHADMGELRELHGLRAELDDAIQAAVDGLRADGYTWEAIGEALGGVTRQAALMRYGRRQGRWDDEARARLDAQAAGPSSPEPAA